MLDKDKKETIGRGSASKRGGGGEIRASVYFFIEYRLLFVNRLIGFDLTDRLLSLPLSYRRAWSILSIACNFCHVVRVTLYAV